MEKVPKKVESVHTNILQGLGFKQLDKKESEEISRVRTLVMEQLNISIPKEIIEARLKTPRFYRTMDGKGTIAIDELGHRWEVATTEDLTRFGFKYLSSAETEESMRDLLDRLDDFHKKPKN